MANNDHIMRLARKAAKSDESHVDLIMAIEDLFEDGKMPDQRVMTLMRRSIESGVHRILMSAIDEAAISKDTYFTDQMGHEREGRVGFWAIPVYGLLSEIDKWLIDPASVKEMIPLLAKSGIIGMESSMIAFPGSYDPFAMGFTPRSRIYDLTVALEDAHLSGNPYGDDVTDLIDRVKDFRVPACEEPDALGVRIALVGVMELDPLEEIIETPEEDHAIDLWIDLLDDLSYDDEAFFIDVPVPLYEAHRAAFDINLGQWEAITKANTTVISYDGEVGIVSFTAQDGPMVGQSLDLDAAILRQDFPSILFELVEDRPFKYCMPQLMPPDLEDDRGPLLH